MLAVDYFVFCVRLRWMFAFTCVSCLRFMFVFACVLCLCLLFYVCVCSFMFAFSCYVFCFTCVVCLHALILGTFHITCFFCIIFYEILILIVDATIPASRAAISSLVWEMAALVSSMACSNVYKLQRRNYNGYWLHKKRRSRRSRVSDSYALQRIRWRLAASNCAQTYLNNWAPAHVLKELKVPMNVADIAAYVIS